MRVDEILLDNINFITKYGTTCEELKPSVIYIKSKTKITPTFEKSSFEDEIDKIKIKFKNYIETLIKNHKSFEDVSISNIEISSKSVTYKKVSHLKYDLYIRPKIKRNLEKYQRIVETLTSKINSYLIKLLNKNKLEIV